MNVFLSHAWTDLEAKNRVRFRLRAERLPIWDDRSFIRGGDRLDLKIEEALRNSGVFFLLWSKAADQSKWVRNELAFFKNIEECASDRLIVPLLLDETPLPLLCASLCHYRSDDGHLSREAWDVILSGIRRNSLIV